MKILGKIIIALCVVAMAACSSSDTTTVGFSAIAGDTHKISPSKKMETRNLSLKDFNGIDIVGSFKVNIRQGTTYAVQVTLPENYFNYLKAKSNGSKLEISMNSKYNYKWPEGKQKICVINITMPKLKSIDLSGQVDAKVLDNFYYESLNVEVSGQSSVDFGQNISLKKLVAECTGQSAIDFENITANSIITNSVGQSAVSADNISSDNISIGCSGQSSVKVDEIKAQKLECDCSGQSTVKFDSVTATNADLNASGMSKIKAKKSDVRNISKDISGMSSIEL
jgi:hypothetical protein